MAKKSKIAKNEQRKEIVERYAEKRAQLKKTLVDPTASAEAAPRCLPGARAQPRQHRRPSPRHLPEVRHLPHPVPRYGPPRRAARHHQVFLVKPQEQPRLPH